jgi:hypothetical protein
VSQITLTSFAPGFGDVQTVPSSAGPRPVARAAVAELAAAIGDGAGQGRMSVTAIWPTSTPSSTTGMD